MSEKYFMSISCDGKCEICEHYKKAYLLGQESQQLKDRINKAIEYIDYIKIDNAYDNVLKEILKEDNKEEI